MARVQKGGRKKDETKSRYPGGQPMPVNNDFGPLEQRLKREVAAGIRTIADTNAISGTFYRLSKAGISQSVIGVSKVQKRAIKDGIVTQEELSLVLAFNSGPPMRRGLSAMDILLARNIIDTDQFDIARDFVACWCAYIGRPWPKGWSAERQSPDFNGGSSEGTLKHMKIRYWNCLAAMDFVDKAIYPLVRDVVVYGKVTGLVEDVLTLDIVRIDGELIGRATPRVQPYIRSRIGRLTCGIEIIGNTRQGDYSREAEALLSRLKARDSQALSDRMHSYLR